ncbi:MAG: hypothetical protein IMZ57_01920 [Acidobacteria bacterium]|nr:hypothetical protein [Acidobacteriota bacterium]
MTDVVPVHRWVALNDPVGLLQEPHRPARFLVGLNQEGRSPDAEGAGQGFDGARENRLLI